MMSQLKNSPDCSAAEAELRRGRVTPARGHPIFMVDGHGFGSLRPSTLPELDHAALPYAFQS